MRTMWDAIHAVNIPTSAAMVAGYDNGPVSQWSPADWARFPNAVKVHISVSPWANTGHVLDVENGDATPQHAPAWAQARRSAGLATPCVYCNMSTFPSVRAAFQIARIPEPLYWLARPGAAELEVAAGATVIATQYEYRGDVDLSVVADCWPGVDATPAPAPDPTMAWQEEIMGRLPTLTIGARDTVAQTRFVRRMQALLTAMGIDPGGVDGVFGPHTCSAVKTAQRQAGLAADGVVGPHTWSVLVTGADL